MKITKAIEEKIQLIASVASYGDGWANRSDYPDGLGANELNWVMSSKETVAHIVACCVCQWITHDSEDTGEWRDALKLGQGKENKSAALMAKRIRTVLMSSPEPT